MRVFFTVVGLLSNLSLAQASGSRAQDMSYLEAFTSKSALTEISNPQNWLVIIGDSGVTGAASNPELKASVSSLLDTIAAFTAEPKMTSVLPELKNYPSPDRFGITKINPMTRVLYSKSEFDRARAKNEVAKLNLGAKASLRLNLQENGFGYMVGHALGMKARDIVLVGQDGMRVSHIPEQFERILEMKTQTLPPRVLLSFNANDFCDREIFTETVEERVGKFKRSLDEAWDKSHGYLKAHPAGTRIAVLAPLEVANILANDGILSQEIEFEGHGRVTCRSLREGQTRKTFWGDRLTDAINGMCRSVLETKPTDIARLDRLRAIQNGINEVWKTKIHQLNERYRQAGLEWTYIERVRDIQFERGDVANDCFHPSVNGHAKIADEVLRSIR